MSEQAESAGKKQLSREEKRRLIQSKIDNMRIFDNLMFQVCAKDNPLFVEHLLRPVVKEAFGEHEDIKIIKVQIDDIQPNAIGRGARLDAVAEDAQGRIFCVEIQRKTDSDNLKYRVRFYHGILDSKLLLPNQEFKEIPEVNLFFLCEGDPRGLGKPYYESTEMWVDDKTPVGNGIRNVYTNGEWRGDDRIGRLNHDLLCKDPDQMLDSVLADAVRNIKSGGKDVEKMHAMVDPYFDDVLKMGIEQGIEQGIGQGIEQGEQSVLQKLIDAGVIKQKDVKKIFKDKKMPKLVYPSAAR